MGYFKIEIAETGRASLRGEPMLFNRETKCFKTLEEVREFIEERYGRIPRRTAHNTVYAGEGEPVGFTYSYWNRDWSHATKSWYQTDWVTVAEVAEKPVLVR